MRKNAAIGIIFDENKSHVLLVKRHDVPIWVLPGGGIDHEESSKEAVIREVLEETGLEVKIIRKVAEYTPINNLARPTEVYECSTLCGNLQQSAETVDINFFPVKQLPKNFFSLHQEWVHDALQNHSEVIQRSLNNVTYWNLIKYFLQHPSWVVRFLFTLIRNKDH